MNISSLVVKCLPENIDSVIIALESNKLCEVHAHDEHGRIVVVLEGANVEEETHKLALIQALPNVISAEMVYAFSEEEFAAQEGMFEKASPELMKMLNSDMDAKDIVYHGHIKDK